MCVFVVRAWGPRSLFVDSVGVAAVSGRVVGSQWTALLFLVWLLAHSGLSHVALDGKPPPPCAWADSRPGREGAVGHRRRIFCRADLHWSSHPDRLPTWTVTFFGTGAIGVSLLRPSS